MSGFGYSRVRLSFLLTAFAIALFGGACSNKQKGGFAPPPTPVEIAEVHSGEVTDKFEAVGSFEAAEAITVVTEIDAVVDALPFEEGQAIKQGGLIAQLDDDRLRAEVASAEATRDQAKVTYDRTKEIVDAKAAAKQDLDNATAALKVAEARLEQAQVMLDKTRITAPFSGVVGTRWVSPGAYLHSGDAITTLTQISQLKIEFSAPERTFPSLARGSKVAVSSPAYPGYELEGTISVVDPVIDQTTRSVQVIARVDNTERRLRPGMSADVSVVLSRRPAALTIPDEAVFAEGNQSFVYVIKPDSTVIRTAVTLGSRQRGTVEITQGLSAGEKVVQAGHQKLYDGAKVTQAVAAAGKGAPGQPKTDKAAADSI